MGLKQDLQQYGGNTDKTLKAISNIYSLMGEAASKDYGTLKIVLSNIEDPSNSLVSYEEHIERYGYNAWAVLNHFLNAHEDLVKSYTSGFNNVIEISLTWDSMKGETILQFIKVDKTYSLEDYIT